MKRTSLLLIAPALLLAVIAALAQRDTLEGPKRPGPSVSLVTTGPVAISKTKPTKFSLTFRVAPGYHVNSHTPKSENLIPTSLKLDPPQDIAVGKFVYPPGQDFAFSFSPDEKLSVYQNDFTIAATATTTANADAGTFKMRGELTYQACDNRQCYPPKKAPVDFDIRVQKSARKGRRSPGQSPHSH